MRASVGENLRHVVFADTRRRYGRAINFTPQRARDAAVFHEDFYDEENALLIWIFNQAGLSARHYRADSLNRRFPALLRALQVTAPSQVKPAIMRDPRLLGAALNALVIGVTSFFRDAHIFSAIDRDILPLLCERGRAIRAWSVGCSDGAELYSLAILLAERKRLHACELLGTDCRHDAVQAAVAGKYDAAAVETMAPELREKYLTREDSHWTIRGWLRTVPQWRVGNAVRTMEPGTWDIILCRNLAMYLKPETASFVWQRLELALRPGGYLIVGRAEQPTSATRLSMVSAGIFQRSKG